MTRAFPGRTVVPFRRLIGVTAAKVITRMPRPSARARPLRGATSRQSWLPGPAQ